ncbi:MAG: acyltransferase [Bacilli bacterium]|nr:acyltransferase [Bacilli bacterium]
MYIVIKFLENIKKFLRIKIKIFYFKLKYGKRLKIGSHLIFEKRFNINMSKNGKLVIGNNNYFNNDCSINCHNEIVIGDDNLFGENVKMYDHSHVFNTKNYNIKKNYIEKEIKIGNYNWICSNAILLYKTNIGSGNVIGANVVLNSKIDNDYIVKSNDNLEIIKIERR